MPEARAADGRAPGALFIVEDNSIMLQTYQLVFESTPYLRVCGAAASAEEALQMLPEAKADVILVDLSLPGMSGLDLVRTLVRDYPDLRIVVSSGFKGEEYVRSARDAGAHGFVPKGDLHELQTVIRNLLP